MATFAEATTVEAIDTRTYSIFFHSQWAVGSVPHGGIVASNVLAAVKLHFDTTLAKYKQPHTIGLHLEYLRRTSTGPAIVSIQSTKLGRRTSTVHIIITQESGQDKSATPTTCVVGYVTQSNIPEETGISLPTEWALDPAPAPLSRVAALKKGEDPNWEVQKERPFPSFRMVGQHIDTHLPRRGHPERGVIDEWIRFSREGERFTQESLGFVADFFPQIVENKYSAEDVINALGEGKTPNGAQLKKSDDGKPLAKMDDAAKFWYPTVVLNLDVKKALPPEGVEFLFTRVRAKQIKNGRMDLGLVILDDSGELVALSNHVVLVLGSERNLKRSNSQDKSKL